MSPITTVVSAFASSAPSPIALPPDPRGGSTSVTSQHLLGTGGFLIVAVVLVSVAGYFYRGRGTNNGRTRSPWASFSNFLSSIRNHGPPLASSGPPDTWTSDPEVGNEHHVSMVYARFFHPTLWNIVECHPATSSAPAIHVEGEADEIPKSDPQPYGMSSFMDIDDDSDDCPHCVSEDSEQLARPKIKQRPPYDTNSPTNVHFCSDIIGATIRPGAFLSVPEECDDGPSEEASPVLDPSCPAPEKNSLKHLFTSSKTHRYGMVDMARFVQHLGATVLEGCPDSRPPRIPRQLDAPDPSKRKGTGLATFREHLEQLDLTDDQHIPTSGEIESHDSCDSFRKSLNDIITITAPHGCPDFMGRLLDELRGPKLDCTPRALSDDSDSEFEESFDFVPPWRINLTGRNSLESTSSLARTESSVSEEGPIYPLTPPSMSSRFSTYQAECVAEKLSPSKPSPITTWHNDELQVAPPTFTDSPLSFPSKAYIRPHRDSRSLHYGPSAPLMALPRL